MGGRVQVPEEKRYIHIRIRAETAAMLKELGKKGETYDDVIRRLIERHLDSSS